MLGKPRFTFEEGNIKVYGNDHLIPLFHFYDLNEKYQDFVRKEYDYIDNLDSEDNSDLFFIYKGWVYHFQDIETIPYYSPKWMKNFNKHSPDTFFSGILIKYQEEKDRDDFANYIYIKVYTYFVA